MAGVSGDKHTLGLAPGASENAPANLAELGRHLGDRSACAHCRQFRSGGFGHATRFLLEVTEVAPHGLDTGLTTTSFGPGMATEGAATNSRISVCTNQCVRTSIMV